jgi:hypothetical protein
MAVPLAYLMFISDWHRAHVWPEGISEREHPHPRSHHHFGLFLDPSFAARSTCTTRRNIYTKWKQWGNAKNESIGTWSQIWTPWEWRIIKCDSYSLRDEFVSTKFDAHALLFDITQCRYISSRQHFNHWHHKTSDKKEPNKNEGLILPITTMLKLVLSNQVQ